MAKAKEKSVVLKKVSHKEAPTNFAKNLRLLRISSGDSQDSLSKKIDVSLVQMGSYERGVEPKLAVLVRIARTLKVSIDDLITGEYEVGQKKKAK